MSQPMIEKKMREVAESCVYGTFGGGNIVDAIQKALIQTRKDVIEECAKVAENVKGGYTANIRTSKDEQELIRDVDGPWVLNGDVARAIRQLAEESK